MLHISYKNLLTYNTHQPNSLKAFTLGLTRKKSAGERIGVDGGNRDTKTEVLSIGRGARSASLVLHFKFYKPFFYYTYVSIYIYSVYIYIHIIIYIKTI